MACSTSASGPGANGRRGGTLPRDLTTGQTSLTPHLLGSTLVDQPPTPCACLAFFRGTGSCKPLWNCQLYLQTRVPGLDKGLHLKSFPSLARGSAEATGVAVSGLHRTHPADSPCGVRRGHGPVLRRHPHPRQALHPAQRLVKSLYLSSAKYTLSQSSGAPFTKIVKSVFLPHYQKVLFLFLSP